MTEKELKKIVSDYIKSSNPSNTGKLQLLAIERFKKDIKNPIYIFDYKKVLPLINFAQLLRQSKGQYANQPLKLFPWQIFIFVNLFCFYYADSPTKRRFRKVYCQVARKQGKTVMMVPILLFSLFSEPGAEIFIGSTKLSQSRIAWEECKKMIEKNTQLSKVCKVYNTSSTILYKDGKIAALSSETNTLDGLSPSVALLDELHEHRNGDMVNVLQTGMGARENPLLLMITTAGRSLTSYCHEEYERAKKIVNGIIEDETYFASIHEMDDADDWQDESKYIKANPSLPYIDTLASYLHKQKVEALSSNKDGYLTKNLNKWVQSSTKSWIDLSRWDKCATPFDENILLGKDCTLGLDLSKVSDFTALSACFRIEGKYIFLHKFYIPEEQIDIKMKLENTQIRRWIDEGYITACSGSTIDYEYIERDIKELSEKYNVISIGYDRALSQNLLYRELQDEYTWIEIAQGIGSLSETTKQYEKDILEIKIIDPNPVQKWMISCAEIYVDANNNIKVVKPDYRKTTNRIDGIYSSLNALKTWGIVEANAMEASNTPVFSASAFDFI